MASKILLIIAAMAAIVLMVNSQDVEFYPHKKYEGKVYKVKITGKERECTKFTEQNDGTSSIKINWGCARVWFDAGCWNDDYADITGNVDNLKDRDMDGKMNGRTGGRDFNDRISAVSGCKLEPKCAKTKTCNCGGRGCGSG